MSRLAALGLGALVLGFACIVPVAADPEAPVKTTALKFEVRLAKGLEPDGRDGRLLIVLAKEKKDDLRGAIGETGTDVPPVLGKDVKGLSADGVMTVDQSAITYPVENLARLPAGDYYVQVVFECNRDLQVVDAPGNLYGDPVKVTLDPAKGGTVKLELSHKEPPEKLPPESEYVKYVKLRSELLSKFHGRSMYLRAGVILPRDFDKDKDKQYPLRVHVGGFGTRFSSVEGMMEEQSAFRKTWMDDDTPRMILLHLDGAGPFGDPYQVNSANNGPYGDAVTQELIPYVEKKFRGIGRPYARVLDGASTGGWVSLGLQVFYPDFFNGASGVRTGQHLRGRKRLRQQVRLRAAQRPRDQRRRALHDAQRSLARADHRPWRPLGVVGLRLGFVERRLRPARRRRAAPTAVGRQERQDRQGSARPLEEVRFAARAGARLGHARPQAARQDSHLGRRRGHVFPQQRRPPARPFPEDGQAGVRRQDHFRAGRGSQLQWHLGSGHDEGDGGGDRESEAEVKCVPQTPRSRSGLVEDLGINRCLATRAPLTRAPRARS